MGTGCLMPGGEGRPLGGPLRGIPLGGMPLGGMPLGGMPLGASPLGGDGRPIGLGPLLRGWPGDWLARRLMDGYAP